jgi:hypothetical protein
MALRSYNPNDCIITFAGALLTGGILSIEIAPNNRTFETLSGIDGDITRVLNNNRTWTATITVMGTSPINDILGGIWRQSVLGINAGGVGSFSLSHIQGGTDLVSTPRAYIANPANIAYAAEPGERVWEIDLVDPLINHGSLPGI